MLILKFSQRSSLFFCFVRNEVFCCTGVCAYVNLDFKRVNVEYARGTLNYSRDDTSSRTRGIRMVMYVYVNLDFKRVNVECARGTLNHYHYDTSSRTRGIRTVSRSCEYACGFSNH